MSLNNAGNLSISGSLTQDSDACLKTHVQPINNTLDAVLALQSIPLNRTSDEPQQTHIGLIVQEVEQVLPEVVFTNHARYKSVAYANIVVILVEATRELEARVAPFEAR